MKQLLLLVALVSLQYAAAQHAETKILDSFPTNDFTYYKQQIETNRHDTLRTLKLAKKWLAKAKLEGNMAQKAMAYKAILHNVKKKYRPIYADSLLVAAKSTADNATIGSAYLTVGLAHYDNKDHTLALHHYLLADKYISRTNNHYLAYKTKYAIANIKYYLGFYNEAVTLFRECVDFFEEENDLAYLKSLHCLGLCYNRIGKYDLTTQTNALGIAMGKELEIREVAPYFTHSEGINQYFRLNFKATVKLLEESLPEINRKKDYANETVAWFYLGKSYLAMEDRNKALPYFRMVDNNIVTKDYIRPDLRENYEILIDYYKADNNLEMQLFYIRRLLEVDKILNQNYKYLSGRILKEYDTKQLLHAKGAIENQLRNTRIIYSSSTAILVGLIVFLVYRHFRNQRIYKKKFEELMVQKDVAPKPLTLNNSASDSDIGPEVTAAILKNLEKFEQNKKYLEKDVTLMKLASFLNTNTKYVSKIILRYRDKKTIEYVTDLKIDYIVKILKTEKKYRNYTNKALGEQAGFGSTQIFTRAFKIRTGISPTYYIQELNKTLPL